MLSLTTTRSLTTTIQRSHCISGVTLAMTLNNNYQLMQASICVQTYLFKREATTWSHHYATQKRYFKPQCATMNSPSLLFVLCRTTNFDTLQLDSLKVPFEIAKLTGSNSRSRFKLTTGVCNTMDTSIRHWITAFILRPIHYLRIHTFFAHSCCMQPRTTGLANTKSVCNTSRDPE